MNLQVIISGDGWVLDKHGALLAEAFVPDAIMRTQPIDGWADITYLMNYAQIMKVPAVAHGQRDYGKVVAMLTHHEPDNHALNVAWECAMEMADALVPMSQTTAAQIPKQHIHKSTTIPLPVPGYIMQRRPRIGIAGIRNPANEHRKGWDLVDRLRADHPEWDITTTGGALSEPEMLAWYRSLDVYLCPSRYEGGPMGVLEAHAMGVSVVKPHQVGWCDDVPGATFRAGDYATMERAVATEAGYMDCGTSCGNYTTTDYIEAHRRLFASLL